ncbi:MAG: class I SAM-dependent DNA methyltransferase [Acidobacteriota bacterium]
MPLNAGNFITRWQQSSAAERANYALFLSELCDYLDLPRPDPTQADEAANSYVIDKAVYFQNLDGSSTTNYIDLYKRNCFVLEAKQGSNPQPNAAATLGTPKEPRRMKRGTAVRGTHGWDEAMLAARGQAERYAKALPISEGWPPFLVVVDVGHSIELYADFSLTGKAYLPFPDPRTFRILHEQLEQVEIKERLRAVWLDPLSLDPSRETAKVTREVAGKLAILARNLELHHPPKQVAEFLTRCIFTSFAEDVKLLPERSWLNLLESLRVDVANFPPMAEALWQTMNEGGFSPILRAHILKFNGGLFESTKALPLTPDQLGLLIEAADSRWRDVEPAIFGTLLERALDPDERHALGAHYTPRAYVERLVIPTLVEPLRDDWRSSQAVIAELINAGDREAAIETARAFHRQLCSTRVLDPACGSGNFLYVSLEHMKRLEGEVLETLHALGETQQSLEHTGLTVDPHQLLGLELNPRAAVVADLVLWIGYLQWHFRTRGDAQPPIPVISNFHNIVEADALLTWKKRVPLLDKDGNAVTQWDGVTTKKHPTTGQDIPDETARVLTFEYLDVKQAKWPEADFIVGNPPFIGGKDIRAELGDGYVKALRKAYDLVPDSADLVMYWWQRAAELARAGKIRRFGFITTNSLPQVFNRKVVAQNLDAASDSKLAPLSLIFAIPDHPWLKSALIDGQAATDHAAVRIAMTVGERGEHVGHLYHVKSEGDTSSEGTDVELVEETGRIFADLRIGVDVAGAMPLKSNEGLCCPGVKLHGAGFIVTPEEAAALGLGRISGLEKHIRPYLNGRDLTGTSRNVMVIDLFGLNAGQVQKHFPEVYQRVYDLVKPERDQNRRASYSDKWWIFGEPRSAFRPALVGLSRYVSTVETAKHRAFVFLDTTTLPDNMLVNIASADAFHFGVLSSKIHIQWALAAGGTLEDRPRYNKTRCFDPFPFPDASEVHKGAIRDIAEYLDAHRKRQQQLHPTLTLTEMYNVLEMLRANEELTAEDQSTYEMGLIGILRQIHDELDEAVFAAYGWSPNLTTEQILAKIVALNAVRRSEEASGIVRWLRPEFQAPNAPAMQQTLGGLVPIEAPAVARCKQPWPATLTDQFRAIKDALRATPFQTPQQIASGFKPASRRRVQEILQTLTALGQTRQVEDKYLL